MRDGSGLSRGDTLSTKLLTDVIMYMDNKKELKFEELFPVAGKEGTVASFLKNTPLNEKARIKSGSMGWNSILCRILRKDNKRYALLL